MRGQSRSIWRVQPLLDGVVKEVRGSAFGEALRQLQVIGVPTKCQFAHVPNKAVHVLKRIAQVDIEVGAER